jgi:hypothetical protein
MKVIVRSGEKLEFRVAMALVGAFFDGMKISACEAAAANAAPCVEAGQTCPEFLE